MRAIVSQAAIVVGLIVSGSHAAADVRLTGNVSQDFRLTERATAGTDWVFSSRTGVNFALTSETPRSRISLSSGATLGYTDAGGFEFTRPQANLSYSNSTSTDTFSAGLSFARNPIEYDEEQPDLSILTLNGTQTRIRGNIGYSRVINRTLSGNVGLSFQSLDFDPTSPALVPSTNTALTGGLSYALNRNTSVSANARVGYFNSDSGVESLTYSLSGGVEHDVNSTTSVNGGLGVSLVDTNGAGNPDLNLVFDAGISHDLPDGSARLSLSQDVSPSASGDLILDTALRARYGHDINSTSSLGLTAAFNRQENTGTGNVDTFVSVTPSYTVDLTEDISARAAYTYRQDDNGNTSQIISVRVSKAFDFPL